MQPEKGSLVLHTGGGGERADIHDIQEFSCGRRKKVLSYTREMEGRGLTYTTYKNFHVTRERKYCLAEGGGEGLTYMTYKNFRVTRERKSCLTHERWRGGG